MTGFFTKAKYQSGISLIELMLSVIIMACAMIPIAGIMGYGFRGTQRDHRQIRAIQLCQERLNQVMGIPFARLVSTSSPISSGTEVLVPLGPVTIDGTNYTASLQVSNKPVNFTYRTVDINNAAYTGPDTLPYPWIAGNQTLNLATNYALEVVVSVTWNENTKQQSVSLTSFRAKQDF